ncbi:MAG: D-hexose-6-phosphate mutarotase [Comamonas sp.]
MSQPWQPVQIQGIAALRYQSPRGDSVAVALQGAQVLSWQTADGTERLYLSPRSAADGHTAIRGGIPVCFPQFNQRGPLPKHGFARNLPWQVVKQEADGLEMALCSSEATRAWWPEAFEARLSVALAPGRLRVRLRATNTGERPWALTAALHTYLRVADITRCTLQGLQGLACWDALADTRFAEPRERIASGDAPGEGFDRVFSLPAGSGTCSLLIEEHAAQSTSALKVKNLPNSTEIVVWNPGAALSAELADMPDDGWRHMLCVEAASIDAPVALAPGQSWEIAQELAV